jgi:hypothetical protein
VIFVKIAAAKNIDEYIAGFPRGVQEKLQKIRSVIKKAAPDAEEAIKYRRQRRRMACELLGYHFLGGLHEGHAVAFGVEEGNVEAVAGDLHGLAEDFATGGRDVLHCLVDICDGDDDRRILGGLVGGLFEEAAVDGTGIFRLAVLIDFCRVGEDVVVEFRAEHLRLPAEDGLVKLRDAVLVFRREFKVDDGVHGLVLPYEWAVCNAAVWAR